MGSLTVIFILELVTGFVAFFFVDKVRTEKLLTFSITIAVLTYSVRIICSIMPLACKQGIAILRGLMISKAKILKEKY